MGTPGTPRAGAPRTAPRRAAVGAAAALALTAALAGCTASGSAGGGDGAGADCAWALSYAAHTYTPLAAGSTGNSGDAGPRPRHTGAPVGTGTLAGCDEGRGKDPDQQVAVYRLDGVDPAQAVVTQDDVIAVRDPQRVPAALRPPRPTPTPTPTPS
jgi:hypothetical protein